MLIRLALILGLVFQPLLALGLLPCRERPAGAAVASEPGSCCCPSLPSSPSPCEGAAACGCAPAEEPGSEDQTPPPGPSAEQLLTVALIADLTDLRPASPAPAAPPTPTDLPAFAGGSAQALFCVWRT